MILLQNCFNVFLHSYIHTYNHHLVMKFVDPITATRRLLYLVSPNETTFQHVDDVPDYINECVPYFALLVVMELFVNLYKQKKHPNPNDKDKPNKIHLNDAITSMATGIMSQLPLLFGLSIEASSYIWFHSKFGLFSMPWDSVWTWIVCFVGVDFAYYWVHRMSHEVSLFWSGHQAHHSSEDYNFTTALRKSVLQRGFSWFFYFPLALVIPPSIFLVHLQFNLIYQFWIHTEFIGKLGPLEWLLNTPSHHRVHHGRNPYCIDKNYGGTFIVFDRWFGTFAAEKDNEKLFYGLVHPIQSFDQVYIQVCHCVHLARQLMQCTTPGSVMKTLLYGPGWNAQKPHLRLGDAADLPAVDPTQEATVFDPPQPTSVNAYCAVHFLLLVMAYNVMVRCKQNLDDSVLLGLALGMVLSLTVIGNLFHPEKFHLFAQLECLRLALLAAMGVWFCVGSPATTTGMPVGASLWMCATLCTGLGISFIFMLNKLLSQA